MSSLKMVRAVGRRSQGNSARMREGEEVETVITTSTHNRTVAVKGRGRRWALGKETWS